MFELGLYLRRRYNKLLGDGYSYTKLYTICTDYGRTVMSAQACLAGLFQPTDDKIWNEGSMLKWQPIPVKKNNDNNLKSEK